MTRKIVNARTGEVTFDDYEPFRGPIEEERSRAHLTRARFLQACVAAGIIPGEVAEDAASGAWPASFDAFLRGLTSDQRIEAKATWADGKTVWRNNDILALIAAHQRVSDAQLDAMFGIR